MEVVDIEILRQKFTEKNLEQVGLKKKNSKLLTKEQYNNTIKRIRELALPSAKFEKSDYSLLKWLQLLEIEVNGDLVTKLVKYGTRVRYVHVEKKFDLILEQHLSTGHGGRDIFSYWARYERGHYSSSSI